MIVSFLLTLILVILAMMFARREQWGIMILCTCGSILSFGAFAIYLLSSA